METIYFSGLGITSAIGQGKHAFTQALVEGNHAFSIMHRPGRQSSLSLPRSQGGQGETQAFLGAEIKNFSIPERIPKAMLRTASFSAQVALATINEAWDDARLDKVNPERIGLVIGGSNFQQRELVQTYDNYQDRLSFLRPTYGMSFMDTDVCGLCTEAFNIRGFAYTLGAASASGQLAVIQAIQSVQSGQVDACIAVGALTDLSYWECHGLRSLGAMGSYRFATRPDLACRPFDRDRDGFIYGENCGAIVVERAEMTRRSDPYGRIAGWGLAMDANRNANPSLEGEIKVIHQAMCRAGISAKDIDYVNPHGTGSVIGDEIELQALKSSNLNHAYINTTKSIAGHGLTAAGNIELIATLLQMQISRLHPSRNLDDPIEQDFNWVKQSSVPHKIRCALKLSFGFGGINTAICICPAT